MAKDIAILDYTIMFSPDETGWYTLAQFEKDLAKFFKEHKMEAITVRGISGQAGRRVLLLEPAKTLTNAPRKTTR